MNRQKLFRQYFTPPAVARAMVDLVQPYLPRNPLVVDLACGEGALLISVLEQGLTSPERIYGLDIDPQVAVVWEQAATLRDCNLQIKDGLAFEPDAVGLNGQGVDLAIGNPPFNRAQDRVTEPQVLRQFRLGHRPLKPAEETLLEIGQLGFDFDNEGETFLVRVFDQVETVVSQPIEALFLEKFIQVTRPGGYVVIILPEGLLSNEGSQDARDLMVEQADVLAIIGLPRRLFDNDAKTSIVLLRKKEMPNQSQRAPVFLAEVSNSLRQGDLQELAEAVQKFHAGPEAEPSSADSLDVLRRSLAESRRVFYVAHSEEAWQANPPDKWLASGYMRWVGKETEPQPGDLLLIYRFPSSVSGAGFVAVCRILASEHRDRDKKGYYVTAEPWLMIDPPIRRDELSRQEAIERWPAYRARFRGWAKGGLVPPEVWRNFTSQVTDRYRTYR